ncbi:MAG TPA: xanthine dehydrogenase family protein molybdopterin-binding subunit [Acidimicrobiia bacterium]|nr:xanthine dehydrogenase family protein molybdopterin-binding subunit [Acidimicrobiia bacterium]
MTVPEESPAPVGSSPHRVGGVGRVTGSQVYVADVSLPGTLHVKLVSLDCARARLVSIDKTRAEQVPGVVMVMTADDLPQPVPRFGPQFQDRPVLAIGETKYHGEPVAAVAAETARAAQAGVAMVDVDFDPLPGGVFTVADALDPDSPLVQHPAQREGDPLAETNTLRVHRYEWGDVDTSEADLVVDNTYEFPMITQFAIEPHGFLAAPGEDGIEVWSSVQHPFVLQRTIATILRLPLAKVRVHAPDPGGGFGGKQHPKYEPLVALIAMATERPARLILSLGETFQTVRRTSATIQVRTGLKSDGSIVSQDFASDFLIGAYVDIADRVVGKSNYLAAGPYRVPNVRIVARSLLSHTTPSTAMRGFGVPQLSWARESNIDQAARELGLDPVELRLRNLPEKGQEFIPHETPADGDWAQTVERAAELIDWGSDLPSGSGLGVAISLKSGPTTGLSYATVRLLADGSVVLYSGTSDMGQGARTIFAQIAAGELGASLDSVTVVMGDTHIVPYDQQTSASRSSVLMGTAILRACHDIQAQLRTLIAAHYDLDVSEVAVEDGMIILPDYEMKITRGVGIALGRLGGEIIGNGELRIEGDPDHPLGGQAVFYEFNCTACRLDVDKETGEVDLTRYVTVGDVGRALNPHQVTGQDEGAAIMGLGHTLMERMILDESGRILNMGAVDYRILTAMDVPEELVSASIENSDGPGPYGIKGVSEASLLATAPAVAAAVTSATGLVIRDLPITPERIWRAMKEES